MTEGSVTRPGLVRAVTSIMLFMLVVFTLIQFELPSIQYIGQTLRNRIVERQMVMEGSGEEAVLKQGWVYFNLGKYDEARKVMEEAVMKDGNISALYCLGLIDMEYGQYEEAVARLEKVAAASPRHTATRINLGKAYFRLRYFRKAGENLEKAVETDPASEEARLLLAKTYITLNKKDAALALLETVNHGREAREAALLMKNLR